ncbi:hypothetical protein EV644_13166 [Kribbella orskensis]|uniref:Uncharacterized protein n=1 Tax=Kribbella orskensis TaxID=2512216 RepID=A0ABY2B8S6_9ACTN|nr:MULTISPECIES: hypothetical protein [Kribbella]TCN30684.1 hypothetical protein EV642_13366 [Kribbella sp. VKM Ac-2500]TCO11403.1 hypothetical protein EV644_13166 [Kribbella orskensis]
MTALWQWRHHTRLEKPTADGISVLSCFLVSLFVAYITAITVTNAWTRDQGLAMPGLVLTSALGAVTLPICHSALNDE